MLLVRGCLAPGHRAISTRLELGPWTAALTVTPNQRAARWWQYPQRGSWDHASHFLPLGTVPKTGCPSIQPLSRVPGGGRWFLPLLLNMLGLLVGGCLVVPASAVPYALKSLLSAAWG